MGNHGPNENLILTLQEIEGYRGQGSGKPSGKYLRYYCPIHGGDNQRSLSLDLETGRFQCFSCGAWGYLAENRQEWRQANRSESTCNGYGSARRGNNQTTSNRSASSFVPPKGIDELPPRPELIAPLQAFQAALPGSPGEEYLTRRGIPQEVAQKYGLGYATPGLWPNPKKYFPQGCIVFPHTNPAGEIINLYGRGVEVNSALQKQHRHAHLAGPKGIFNAQGLTKERVIITEGPFDALSLLAAGYEACAIFGVDGLRWPWVKAPTIAFGFDQDQAGDSWRELACQATLLGIEVYFLPRETYAGFKDLNEVWVANKHLALGEWTEAQPENSPNMSPDSHTQPEPQGDPATTLNDGEIEIKPCADTCPQYVLAEIEPELPAFCLYWGEGLFIGTPICRPFKEGRVPKERVSTLTDLATSKPYALVGLAYCRSPEGNQTCQDSEETTNPPPGKPPGEGRHLVKIKKVQGYLYNFGEYTGPRARLWMEILEGPDAGKIVVDNVSMPHPLESKGMKHRRLRIAYRLGLIQWGTKETVEVNWKGLEETVCSVNVAEKSLGGRTVVTVDGYQLDALNT